MSLFSTGPFSYNRFDEMDKAYNKLYEKKAAKDYDGDGKVESGKEEYFGSRDKAIKKAMGKTVKEGKGEMPDFIKKKMAEKKKEGCSCKESVDYLLQQGVDLSEYTWREMEELFYEGYKKMPLHKMQDKAAMKPDTAKGEMQARKIDMVRKVGEVAAKEQEEGAKLQNRLNKTNQIKRAYKKPSAPNAKQVSDVRKSTKMEEYSKQEVCDYLIDRGYTNNEVSAEVLFNHMSDEWINQILEEG